VRYERHQLIRLIKHLLLFSSCKAIIGFIFLICLNTNGRAFFQNEIVSEIFTFAFDLTTLKTRVFRCAKTTAGTIASWWVMLECYLQAADIVIWSRSKSCLLRLSSPERARLQELQESILASESANQTCTVAPPPLGSSSPSKENLVLYVPEVEEIRISPVIARKGYLNVLEHKTNGWKKRWVVCKLAD